MLTAANSKLSPHRPRKYDDESVTIVMNAPSSLGRQLRQSGVSRRAFLQYCAATLAALRLSGISPAAFAEKLGRATRPSVIWLSFQECTGCTESLTRSHTPSLEALILDLVSLDYHHTLQAASGTAAEAAREQAMRANRGKYLLLVDGSVPTKDGGIYSTIAGRSNEAVLAECADGAAAVIAVGSCAAFGGLPGADPNPTGAVPISALLKDKPVINLPGCPPLPTTLGGIVAHYLAFSELPELDDLGRPLAFYGETIHDRCYRRPFYDQGKFAESFDDRGARAGWCLFKLGCKGPVTYNACATTKWNQGTSFPIASGHGCLGCSEPSFWDAGGFYRALSAPRLDNGKVVAVAAAAGAVAGTLMARHGRAVKAAAAKSRLPVTRDDLEK
jgi:hydrogenase small subunit